MMCDRTSSGTANSGGAGRSPRPRPRIVRRTESSTIFSTTARNLTSTVPFRWRPAQVEIFEDWVSSKGAGVMAADIMPLLRRLDLDGYENVYNAAGSCVHDIIIEKVRRKLARTLKEMDGVATVPAAEEEEEYLERGNRSFGQRSRPSIGSVTVVNVINGSSTSYRVAPAIIDDDSSGTMSDEEQDEPSATLQSRTPPRDRRASYHRFRPVPPSDLPSSVVAPPSPAPSARSRPTTPREPTTRAPVFPSIERLNTGIHGNYSDGEGSIMTASSGADNDGYLSACMTMIKNGFQGLTLAVGRAHEKTDNEHTNNMKIACKDARLDIDHLDSMVSGHLKHAERRRRE